MAKEKKAKSGNNLDLALENLSGFFHKGTSMGIVDKISTGYFELDFAINYGCLPSDYEFSSAKGKDYDPTKPIGIPVGRLVEVFGSEGSGKSYMCYRLAGSAQKLGYKAAWIDTEQSFSEDLARINDVNIDDLIYSDLHNFENPDETWYAEDVLDGIITLIKSGVKLVILDSVANLIPRARMEAQAEQQYVALLPRLLSENIGKIVQWAGAKGALVVFINQLREKPNVMFGNPITSPGGRSLKHNASLRIEIAKEPKSAKPFIFIEDGRVPGGKRLIGRNSRVKIEKNRFSKPFINYKGEAQAVTIPVYYEPYFPDIENIIFDAGRQQKIITTYKGEMRWINASGEKKAFENRDAFISFLKGDEASKDEILEALKVASKTSGIVLPPEILQYDSSIMVREVDADASDITAAEKRAKALSKKDIDEEVEKEEKFDENDLNEQLSKESYDDVSDDSALDV